MTGARKAALVCVALVLGGEPRSAAAQEPDSIPDPDAPGNCTLTWEPVAPTAELLRRPEDADALISRFRGRMLFTCGSATMEADSTIKYDRLRKLDFIGNVVYRDTIRVLQSGFLTYFEIEDLVTARDSVELVRTIDGSRLRGPEIQFLRAVTGVDAQTTARGRPHMTFYPEGDEPQEPFEIDADRASFAGEEEARFHGDVIITRSDLDAAADSAYLTREEGAGVMWGRPWVETEEIRLEGDTIRFRSEDEELREVNALGNAEARGSQFDVTAERIDAELAGELVEQVWAHGEGLSEALSGGHELYGDSMRFVLYESQIDTVISVGSAMAIQRDTSSAMPPPGAADSTGFASDSAAVAAPAPDSTAVPTDPAPDSAGVPPDPGRDSVAVDPGAARDTAAVEVDPEDVAGDVPEFPTDSLVAEAAEVPDDSVRATPPELMEEVLASATPGDTTAQTEDDPEDPLGLAGLPMLATDGSTNWVTADTLIAIFERQSPPTDSIAMTTADSTPPEPVGAVAPSAPAAPASSADSTADPRIERLIAILGARSFYRQVRDSAATDRPSRSYLLGSRIEILFVEGEPRTVLGTNAIGIYLEPEEATATEAAGDAAGPGAPLALPDSLRVGPDSTFVIPDSLRIPGDSTRAIPDSSGTPPDTARASPGSVAARPPDRPAGPPAGRRPPHAEHAWRNR